MGEEKTSQERNGPEGFLRSTWDSESTHSFRAESQRRGGEGEIYLCATEDSRAERMVICAHLLGYRGAFHTEVRAGSSVLWRCASVV